MRRLALFALALALVVGCSKKKPTESAQPEPKPAPKPADTTDADRARLLSQLKTTNEKNRFDAVEELSVWAETDPPTVAALLDLLRDKSTAGSGKTHPMRISSTREAAARALLLAGPNGEAALKDKGLAALQEGLRDPQAAVREHTAYTIGLLGPTGPAALGRCDEALHRPGPACSRHGLRCLAINRHYGRNRLRGTSHQREQRDSWSRR